MARNLFVSHAEHLLQVLHSQLRTSSFLCACQCGFGGCQFFLLFLEDLFLDCVVANKSVDEARR